MEQEYLLYSYWSLGWVPVWECGLLHQAGKTDKNAVNLLAIFSWRFLDSRFHWLLSFWLICRALMDSWLLPSSCFPQGCSVLGAASSAISQPHSVRLYRNPFQKAQKRLLHRQGCPIALLDPFLWLWESPITVFHYTFYLNASVDISCLKHRNIRIKELWFLVHSGYCNKILY